MNLKEGLRNTAAFVGIAAYVACSGAKDQAPEASQSTFLTPSPIPEAWATATSDETASLTPKLIETPESTETAEPKLSQTETPTGEQPNVLIIVTDDQREDPKNEVVMPAFKQRFIDEGTSYSNAFATTPLCCPSRASIMTGNFAHNTGVRTNFEAGKLDQSMTLQAKLKAEGYLTGLVGKFLNRWPIEKVPSYWDRWWMQKTAVEYSLGSWNVNGEVQNVNTHSVMYSWQRSIDFLRDAETEDERPWFLYLAVNAPHSPFTSLPEHEDAPVPPWPGNPATSELDRSDKPPYVQKASAMREEGLEVRTAQLRSLMDVNTLIERLFASLAELEERNTLAVFVSDNGLMWSEHGLSDKRVPYTPSVHIPLAVRWPGRVEQGQKIDDLVANIDIAPTIFEAVGIAVETDGRSLLSTSGRESILLEHPKSGVGVPAWASLRTKKWQYIEYYDKAGAVTFREYYLNSDKYQMTNLLADGDPTNNPNVEWLTRLLEKARSCVASSCP